MSSNDKYLTALELSQRWKGQIKPSTLAMWRSAGKGVKYKKFGGRVLYALSDIEEYEANGKQT